MWLFTSTCSIISFKLFISHVLRACVYNMLDCKGFGMTSQNHFSISNKLICRNSVIKSFLVICTCPMYISNKEGNTCFGSRTKSTTFSTNKNSILFETSDHFVGNPSLILHVVILEHCVLLYYVAEKITTLACNIGSS